MQEDYPTKETWLKRKGHKDYPAFAAYVISTMRYVMQQMHAG